MKKLFYILLAALFFIFLSLFFINSAIKFIAKKQLNAIFKGSEVAIGSCRLDPLKKLSLFEVSIKNQQAYDFVISQVRVEYGPLSIFKGEILKFYLKDAKIRINLPQKSITAFLQYLNLGSKGAFLVNSIEISNLDLDLRAGDANISAVLSLEANLKEKIMDYLDVQIHSLDIQGFNLSDFSLKAAQGSSGGYFGLSQIKYNKINVSGIKSRVVLSGKELFLEDIYATFFDGDIGGNIKFKLEPDFSYDAVFKMANLDIARAINEFDLKEKIEMTGKLTGDLTFKGRGPDIEIINGKLSSLESGGVLMIKDTKFLENMARDTNQSLDLLVENFKKYHYNIGTIKLFLDNNDLILDTALDGETGKRNINIVLHGFKLKKEAK